MGFRPWRFSCDNFAKTFYSSCQRNELNGFLPLALKVKLNLENKMKLHDVGAGEREKETSWILKITRDVDCMHSRASLVRAN
jgi:hypothetical protein